MRKMLLALVLVAVTCLTAVSVSAADPGPIQVSGQSADTSQQAAAASSATQTNPSNTNISIRVLSPGNDGNVTQSNTAGSSAAAGNASNTAQGSSQTAGGGNAIQSVDAVRVDGPARGSAVAGLAVPARATPTCRSACSAPATTATCRRRTRSARTPTRATRQATSQTGIADGGRRQLVWLLRRQRADPDLRPVGFDRPGRRGAVACDADRPVEHLGLGARAEPG